jgi:ectoine hydroxylase-related dioxygenase (phytanoyl-CoA dioxygenase family)
VPSISPALRFTGPDAAAVEHFREQGWVLIRSLDAGGTARLQEWVGVVAAWPEERGLLHYREMSDEGPQLCRTENFVPLHEGLRELLTSGPMLETASALLGQAAVLYKEKVNYKLPGGAGYSPHQDAPAYPFIDVHVSCMVAIDDSSEDNGCLEVVSGAHHEVLPVDERGCIRGDDVARLTWAPVEVRAGETLWFHSRTPHRSRANRSTEARRALYPTYNAAAEGDLRAEYYSHKLQELSLREDGQRVQVSLIGDFEGRRVD